MIRMTLGALLDASGGSIKTGPFGTTLRASEYSETGVPIISVGEVGDGQLHLRTDTPHASADLTSRLSEYVLETDDIVFARKGSVERSARVKASQGGWFLGSDGIRIRPGSADSRYLSYYLRLPQTKAWILRHAAGTTMASLSGKILGQVPIELPKEAQQRAIAAVLGALDDKITANAEVTNTADDLARARYAAMHRHGSVPLSHLARFVNGRAFTKGATGTGRVVIRIAELNSGLGGSTVYNDIDVADDHLARPGDLLFAWSGSLTVHRWYRPEGIINQHIFKVIPQDGYPMWLVHQAVLERLAGFRSIAADKATTMGHIQRHHLDEVVSLPFPEVVREQTDLMQGLWDVALQAERENLTLAELRDTLLPALMSGQLRVKNAERQVEDAV